MKVNFMFTSAVSALLLFSGCSSQNPEPENIIVDNNSSIVIDDNSSIVIDDNSSAKDSQIVSNNNSSDCNNSRLMIKTLVALIDKYDNIEKELRNKKCDCLVAPATLSENNEANSSSHSGGVLPAPIMKEKNNNANVLEEIEKLKKELIQLKEEKQQPVKQNSSVLAHSCKNVNLIRVDPSKVMIAKKDTAIKPCPSLNSIASGKIVKGTILKFRGCDLYGWCELSDSSGFVSGFAFKEVKNSKVIAKFNASRFVSDSNVTLREKPDVKSKKLAVLKANTIVKLSDCGKKWCFVKSKNAFVYKKLFKEVK